ncbi:MAG: DinB family protein [Ignavibacteriaceae bacterium]
MRPLEKDYAPFYKNYIENIEGENILEILNKQNQLTQNVLNSFSEHKGSYSYAPGKWTVKEVVGHMSDTERVFAYRALCIARGDKQPLPGFEQDDYVKEGNFNKRNLFDLNYDYRLLRESNLLLFKSFDDKMLARRGTASGYEVTVNALLFMIAGHSFHHIEILKTRYL